MALFTNSFLFLFYPQILVAKNTLACSTVITLLRLLLSFHTLDGTFIIHQIIIIPCRHLYFFLASQKKIVNLDRFYFIINFLLWDRKKNRL